MTKQINIFTDITSRQFISIKLFSLIARYFYVFIVIIGTATDHWVTHRSVQSTDYSRIRI